jgi:hypothetical protein
VFCSERRSCCNSLLGTSSILQPPVRRRRNPMGGSEDDTVSTERREADRGRQERVGPFCSTTNQAECRALSTSRRQYLRRSQGKSASNSRGLVFARHNRVLVLRIYTAISLASIYWRERCDSTGHRNVDGSCIQTTSAIRQNTVETQVTHNG